MEKLSNKVSAVASFISLTVCCCCCFLCCCCCSCCFFFCFSLWFFFHRFVYLKFRRMAKQKKFATAPPSHCPVVTPSSVPVRPPTLSNCLSTFIGAAHLHRIKLIINMATGQVADPIPTTSKNKLPLLPERKKN